MPGRQDFRRPLRPPRVVLQLDLHQHPDVVAPRRRGERAAARRRCSPGALVPRRFHPEHAPAEPAGIDFDAHSRLGPRGQHRRNVGEASAASAAERRVPNGKKTLEPSGLLEVLQREPEAGRCGLAVPDRDHARGFTQEERRDRELRGGGRTAREGRRDSRRGGRKDRSDHSSRKVALVVMVGVVGRVNGSTPHQTAITSTLANGSRDAPRSPESKLIRADPG
jgi:hypothetical protein